MAPCGSCATPCSCVASAGSDRDASVAICADTWESLRGDPLPWLLDPQRPNLHWRVLVELVRRPPTSSAVIRARGGAEAAEPVASLLAELLPDGSWSTGAPLWRRYDGPGWRLLAAVQWGADPTDPRLQAACGRLLETAPGEGGFALRPHGRSVPWLTARALQGLGELGWCRHPRFQEGLAWLEEGGLDDAAGGWRAIDRGRTSGECVVTAVAILGALTACADHRRKALMGRAIDSVIRALAAPRTTRTLFGHPCMGRTDEAEMLWALARAAAPFEAPMVSALNRIQKKQLEGGRWRCDMAAPSSLPIAAATPRLELSRWLTLKCVVALLAYAVDAQLPRVYPPKP
jgi:hypothetical protein